MVVSSVLLDFCILCCVVLKVVIDDILSVMGKLFIICSSMSWECSCVVSVIVLVRLCLVVGLLLMGISIFVYMVFFWVW